MQLIRADTSIDFMGQSRLMGLLSLGMVLLFLAIIGSVGFNLGIEFVGGTVVQVQVPAEAGDVDEGNLRAAVPDASSIVRFGAVEDREFRIHVLTSAEANEKISEEIEDALNQGLGTKVIVQQTESIGPRVGEEMQRAGFGSVALACGLILIYIWLRFDLRYAPGAVAALVHDVVFTAGIFAVMRLEFNLQVLAALLVVIGYSLNDTIVIYDRIRENLELRGVTHLEDVINQSINQTLSRTLLKSMTTLIVVLALLFLGGPVIRDFAIALTIGIVVGTYSTIYVASGLLVLIERYMERRAGAS